MESLCMQERFQYFDTSAVLERTHCSVHAIHSLLYMSQLDTCTFLPQRSLYCLSATRVTLSFQLRLIKTTDSFFSICKKRDDNVNNKSRVNTAKEQNTDTNIPTLSNFIYSSSSGGHQLLLFLLMNIATKKNLSCIWTIMLQESSGN